jgi:flavin reductase (DIM6/NTAB) family NADH-FMN oxidoreductase RutF
MTTPILEPQHLRSCLSRFVTGVAVVSYQADGELRGLTVNSFTSVSLDPPLIVVSLARQAKAVEHLSRVPFTINVLKASQFDIALQFAGRPRPGLRVEWNASNDDLAPTLKGALATFQCRPWHAYDGGDHILQLGQVVQADVSGHDEPLLFDRGRFAMVGLSLFDNPRVIEAAPIIGGGIVRNQLVHHLTAAAG